MQLEILRRDPEARIGFALFFGGGGGCEFDKVGKL